MIRLIGTLLLISPLWAVSVDLVQEMQQARALVVKIYYQDFKERYTRINWDMVFSHAMQKEAPALVKHLQAFIDHIPILQSFQPKTPKQAQMIQALKALEMYNLFILLSDSTPEYYCAMHGAKCRKMKFPKRVKPFDAQQNASKFLKNIELIYAPLLEAYYQGLDFTDYLQMLYAKSDPLAPNWAIMGIRKDNLNMVKGPKTPTLRRFFQDFRSIDAHNYLMDSGFIEHVKYFGANEKDGFKDFLVTQIIYSSGAKAQDLVSWMNYYGARAFAFLGGDANDNDYESAMGLYWESVTHLRITPAEDDEYTFSILKPKVPLAKAMQRTLTQNPTPCLQPQYLNQEAKAVCLQIFQQHSYNPKPLQNYLNSLRLLSIDNAPCVYLNSQDKLQVFKSDNALCLALQTNLTKEFK
ncbi:hypothetical protein NHP200010_09140 [Helicobacter bizzozeronii]|uniref:hypothetical protein n=1 Tax=Helicobacter bizzozeronii TaxID=56877 RepID=UPI00244D81B5|nr:hypothetical protein [Helicobacter bizzozeronii]GMB93201.1 hypothetical protein NHP200010_09140 [Helicobacter bizzozeronii]